MEARAYKGERGHLTLSIAVIIYSNTELRIRDRDNSLSTIFSNAIYCLHHQYGREGGRREGGRGAREGGREGGEGGKEGRKRGKRNQHYKPACSCEETLPLHSPLGPPYTDLWACQNTDTPPTGLAALPPSLRPLVPAGKSRQLICP